MNDDYWQGYNSRVSKPDNIEHQRGYYDRRDEEYNAGWVSTASTPKTIWDAPAGNTVAGGGGTLLLLFFGVYLAFKLVPSWPDIAFVTLVFGAAVGIGSLLLIGEAPLLAAGTRVRYKHARRAVFSGLFWYVSLALLVRSGLAGVSFASSTTDPEAVLTRAWQSLAQDVRTFSMTNDWSSLATISTDRRPNVLAMLLMLRLPGALVFGRLLAARIANGAFSGLRGFLFGTIVAMVTAELSLLAAHRACLAAWSHIQVLRFGGDERLAILVLYSALVILPCALVAGVLGAALIPPITGRREPLSPYRRRYSAAVRAFLAYGLLTVLSVFLFRDSDAVLWWVARTVLGDQPGDPALAAQTIGQGLAALAVLQLPAAIAAGAVLFNRSEPAVEGIAAFAKVCMAAMLSCWLIAVPIWVAALQALPRIVAAANAAPGNR